MSTDIPSLIKEKREINTKMPHSSFRICSGVNKKSDSAFPSQKWADKTQTQTQIR